MTLVEKIKAHWSSWLLQGIPAAVVVLGAVLSMGKTLGDYNQRVLTLEADKIATASQIGALSQKIDDMSHQIQRLQDRLEDKGDISYPQALKHGVNYSHDSSGISSIPYLPPR
jgi:hypothetical protein